MAIIDQDLLNELITESNEHLDRIEPGFLAMEGGNEVAPDLINEIFRAIHSIKGGFGFFGLNNIKELSHKMESVLMLVRDGELAVNSSVADALLAGVDKLRAMIDEVQDSDEVSIEEELRPLKIILGEEVDELAVEETGRAGEESAEVIPKALPAQDNGEIDLQKLEINARPGTFVYHLSVYGDELKTKGRKSQDLVESCMEIGEIFHQDSDLADCDVTGKSGVLIFSTIMEHDHLSMYLNVPADQLNNHLLK